MPNWCYNNAVISHDSPEMMERLVSAAESGNLFDEFVPMPEELRGTTAPTAFPSKSLIEKYGSDNWYDWSVKNWGTKWEAGEVSADATDTGLYLSFDTAWGPPIPYYDTLTALGFKIDATYSEEGMSFVGHYCDGEDDCIELDFDNMSEEWIKSIPDETLRDLVESEYENWLAWNEDTEE